jgi:hypothetical protein
MTMADAERWIASYNSWVEIWNRHERSRDLPLSPEWLEADYLMSRRACLTPRSLAQARIEVVRRELQRQSVIPINCDKLERIEWESRGLSMAQRDRAIDALVQEGAARLEVTGNRVVLVAAEQGGAA